MARRRKPRKRKLWVSKKVVLLMLFLIVVAVIVIYSVVSRGGSDVDNLTVSKVLLQTSMGDIVIELYDNMPITLGNFKNLTEHGVFDSTTFHRVVHDFVIQGGDASAKGISVPTIPDELPNKHSNVRGSVAMAKTSLPNSATSQFYINLKDNANLDSNYSVFGRVIEGMDVVDSIGEVATDANDKPLQDVTVIKAELID